MQDLLKYIAGHAAKSRPCPICGRQIKNMEDLCDCGYCAPVIYCPKCMTVLHTGTMADRETYLNGCREMRILEACDCGIPYREAPLSCRDYYQAVISISSDMQEAPRSAEELLLIDDLAQGKVNRVIFDAIKDKSAFDFEDPGFQRQYAFMFPASDTGRKFLLKEFGECDLHALIEKFRSETPQDHIPKCPICGSTRLERISQTGTVIRIASFGLAGAGNVGKTWKCKQCGSKF